MADAHREQLEQLAPEVLVGVRLDVLAIVEEDEHRRIFRMPSRRSRRRPEARSRSIVFCRSIIR